jgi:hypothetical protein
MSVFSTYLCHFNLSTDNPLAWKVGDMEKALATASMVTRWREANPDLVGTEKDCVRQYITELQAALGGKDECFGGSATAILLFKKSA